MTPKRLGRLLIAVLACGLLNGCRSDFHLVLFNDTDDTIVLRLRPQDRTPLVVVAGISGEITGVSTDDFSIEQNGKVRHYHFPAAYAYPSNPSLRQYERRVPPLGRAVCFQLSQDNLIYVLRRHEQLVASSHPPQPPGFPLLPR